MGAKELFIAIVPVVVLLVFIYIKDVDKEPRKLLIKLFLFGCLSVIPILIGELLIDEIIPTTYIPNFFISFITTFISVALVEEIGKWFVTYFSSYKSKDYNHSFDGIVYAVFVSLGFAIVENVLYVYKFGFDTGVDRAKFSIPGHAVFGVFMGYYLSLSKSYALKGDKKSLWYLILSILVPSLCHAIYDSIILYYQANPSLDYLSEVFIIYVYTSYSIAIGLVNKTAQIKYNFDGRKIIGKKVNSNYCYYCGAPITDRICSQCGKDQSIR